MLVQGCSGDTCAVCDLLNRREPQHCELAAAQGVTPMDVIPVHLATVAEVERAEANTWADLYAAAPAEFADSAGLGYLEVGGALVLRWAATGRRYFSRTIGLDD